MRKFDIIKNYQEEIESTDRMIEMYTKALEQEKSRKKYFEERIEDYKKRLEAIKQ